MQEVAVWPRAILYTQTAPATAPTAQASYVNTKLGHLPNTNLSAFDTVSLALFFLFTCYFCIASAVDSAFMAGDCFARMSLCAIHTLCNYAYGIPHIHMHLNDSSKNNGIRSVEGDAFAPLCGTIFYTINIFRVGTV